MNEEKYLSPAHCRAIDARIGGLSDIINKVLAAGIPGVTWQTILQYIIEHGAPVVLSWLNTIYQQWKAGTLPTPIPPPDANAPGVRAAMS